MVTDPVCGRSVDTSLIDTPVGKVSGGAPEVRSGSGAKRFHAGQWWYFCSYGCTQRFLGGPDPFVEKAKAAGGE